jgi:hypothetical protein
VTAATAAATRAVLGVCVATALITRGDAARADDRRPRFMIDGTASASFEYAASVPSDDNLLSGLDEQQIVELTLTPRLSVFVTERVTLGAGLGLVYFNDEFLEPWSYGGNATLGYYARLDDRIAFWPQILLAASWATGRVENGLTVPVEVTANVLATGVLAPVLFHLSPGLFVGAGPVLTAELVVELAGEPDGRDMSLGLTTLLGGMF